MLKALKVILISFGVLRAFSGLMHILFAEKVTMTFSGQIAEACKPTLLFTVTMGISWLASGIYLIIAGTKDVLRHIYWVQFALLWSILGVAGTTYSILMGYAVFNRMMGMLIGDAAFFVLLLIFYPRGRREE